MPAPGEPAAAPSAPRGPAVRHLVLLGLPGAGKSTVGPLAAALLERPFVDLDAAIEAIRGQEVGTIFADEGEAAFRDMERRLSARLLDPAAEPIVLSPGGGWVEDAANRALLGKVADAVYLRVSPAVAVKRMGASISSRPLLAGADPALSLSRLLARREAFYLLSRHTVSVDSLTPDEVATSIVALARGG